MNNVKIFVYGSEVAGNGGYGVVITVNGEITEELSEGFSSKSNGNYISFNGNSGGSGGQSGIVSGGDAGAAGGSGATNFSENGKFPGGGGAAGNYGTNCPIVGGDGASGRVIISW